MAMRRLALAGLARFMLAGLVLAGVAATAAAQDSYETCTRGVADLQDMLACLGASAQRRPLDDDSGLACEHLKSVRWVRPSAGRRVLAYGERTQYGSTSKGVVFETGDAETVVAPAVGLVIYAGEFRSYGKLIVLEPGCGLTFIIAGGAKARVVHGQVVLPGEPLADMSAGSSEANRPVLYVELRRLGRPINPGLDIDGQ